MKLFWIYLVQALRSMRHRKQQTLLSLLGLTVGMVCFTFSINWLWNDTHYESFRPGYRDLLEAHTLDKATGRYRYGNFAYATAEWLRDSVPGVRQASAAGFVRFSPTVDGKDVREDLRTAYAVHPEYLEMMGIRLLHGDARTALDRPNAIILPRSVAIKLFGREDALGSPISVKLTYEGSETQLYVSGVMEDQPDEKGGSTLRPNALVPVSFLPEEQKKFWLNNRCRIIFKADKPELVERMLGTKTDVDHCPLIASPLRLTHAMEGKESLWESLARPVQFVGLSLLLLLAALFNYIALLTSQWMGRRREYQLRLSLGGTWRSNMGWLYAEVGLMLGIVALLSLPALELLCMFADLDYEVATPYHAFFCVLPVFVAMTLLAALYPLWYIHRISRRASLRDGRPLLLAIQIGIGAVMLFVFSGMFSQFRYMMKGNMGFNIERVYTLRVGVQDCNRTMLDLLRQRGTDCIEDAVGMPLALFEGRIAYGWEDLIHESTQDTVLWTNCLPTAPEVFRFFDIKPLEGELPLKPQERDNNFGVNPLKQIVVNTDMVESFPPGVIKPGVRLRRRDAMNKSDKGEFEVVGIVDVKRKALNDMKKEPTFFTYQDDANFFDVIYLRHKPGKADEAVALARSILAEQQVPEEKIEIGPMNESITRHYKTDRKHLRIFSLIAAAAVLVLLFGVYSFVAFVLRSHRKSIAVRRVFGATKGAIYKKYLRTYVLLTAVACAAAFPLARYLCSLWLQSFRSSVQIGWTHFLLIMFGLSTLVALVVIICLRRTLSENPADVIKEE